MYTQNAFEEASIYYYGWVRSVLCNLWSDEMLYIVNVKNAFSVLWVDYYSTLSIVFFNENIWNISCSWYMLPDNNFVMIIYVICLYVVAYSISDVWYWRDGLIHNICNRMYVFVYSKIVVAYLGHSGALYYPFILYTFYVILCGNLFCKILSTCSSII